MEAREKKKGRTGESEERSEKEGSSEQREEEGGGEGKGSTQEGRGRGGKKQKGKRKKLIYLSGNIWAHLSFHEMARQMDWVFTLRGQPQA